MLRSKKRDVWPSFSLLGTIYLKTHRGWAISQRNLGKGEHEEHVCKFISPWASSASPRNTSLNITLAAVLLVFYSYHI